MMEKYFKVYAREELQISFEELMALGRRNPGEASAPFNMAYLGIRGSGGVEWRQPSARPRQPQAVRAAVSPLAGSGSARRQCHQRHPRSHVGFGRRRCSMGEACGEERWRGSLEYVEEQIRCLDDREIWDCGPAPARSSSSLRAKRLRAQRAYQGAAPEEIVEAGEVFDPGWLTIGFARRFAEYKRPHLLTA